MLRRVQLVTPRTGAHQASLSMGFPRQGYWNGLRFPSPRDLPHPYVSVSPALAGRILYHYAWRSLYIAAMLCLVTQLCLTLCNIMVCSLPGSFVHGISQRKYWSELPFPSLGDLPGQGIEPRSPTLQVNSLSSEPPGNPGVHS